MHLLTQSKIWVVLRFKKRKIIDFIQDPSIGYDSLDCKCRLSWCQLSPLYCFLDWGVRIAFGLSWATDTMDGPFPSTLAQPGGWSLPEGSFLPTDRFMRKGGSANLSLRLGVLAENAYFGSSVKAWVKIGLVSNWISEELTVGSLLSKFNFDFLTNLS